MGGGVELNYLANEESGESMMILVYPKVQYFLQRVWQAPSICSSRQKGAQNELISLNLCLW